VEDATGAVLFAKDPDRQLPPASTTKIVTGMILARDLPPEALIPVSPQAAATPGHRLGLRSGDRLPARDMLYAVMLISANDASTAVAEKMDGTEARFADRMNQEAQRAGATRSHFVNPHGLPASGHLSTVRDLATLARAALRVPAFAAAVRTLTYRLSAPNDHLPPTLNNQDPLIGTLPGADGVKTGYTDEAGYCYVGSATRNGRRLIVALLHSPDWQGEARQLLEYGFAHPAASKPAPSSSAGAAPAANGDPSPASPSGSTPSGGSSSGGSEATSTLPGGAQGASGGAASAPPSGYVGKSAPPGRGTLLGKGTPPTGTAMTPPRTPSEHPAQYTAKREQRPPGAEAQQRGVSAAGTLRTGSGLPSPSDAPSLWWLWLLLLLFLLFLLWITRRHLARLGSAIMNRLRTAFANLLGRKTPTSRSIRRATQSASVPTGTKEIKLPAYTFSMPCMPRRPAGGWLSKLLETPPRLLEPAVRRQAAAILDATPQLCNDRLMSLLSSNTLKVRLAACQLVAGAFPRRSEETLQAIIEDERTPHDVRQDAAEMLAHNSGDRYEPAWREMLLRDGSPAAARALARQPRLEADTKQAFQKVLNTRAPEKYQDEAARRNSQLRLAHIALTLAAHEALSEEETKDFLNALPAAPREQAVTQALHGVTSPWAVRQLVEIALNGHAYSALQALMDVSPRLTRSALDLLEDPADPAVHTRARIARWLLLKEGDVKEIQQLAQAGNEVAASALNLAHLHHWQPAKASPDALLAAAQIVSLRMGFSDHAPEQIARAFRQAATGEAAPEQLADTPELLPLAEAYTQPEVYDAVQAAMHTEDGLGTLLGEIARHPEKPQYARELAFWSDKTARETRIQIAQALAHVPDDAASDALMERSEDACPAVRNAALRALQSQTEQEQRTPAPQPLATETDPPAEVSSEALDRAA
ncbi:MAG TPA: D-alanyl-D-alanine carboxypeptidase family protein, partial [Chthonomonadaceae bacterium]|nr:D-alanyl-D-alanine carboxypeptidase family protein [Chthonomonadaceae bacterium]